MTKLLLGGTEYASPCMSPFWRVQILHSGCMLPAADMLVLLFGGVARGGRVWVFGGGGGGGVGGGQRGWQGVLQLA